MQINPLILIAELGRIEEQFHGFAKSLPEIQAKVQESLCVEMAKIDSRNRSDNAEAITNQCAAIRRDAIRLSEELMGIVLAKRQETVKMEEIKPTLELLAKGAAHSAFLEYGRRHRNEMPNIVADVVKREMAALPQLTQPSELFSFAASFTGNWEDDRLYKRDDVFTFRGSSYVVLKPCRGIVPTMESQIGPDAFYGLIAACGSPGRNGNDLTKAVLTTLTDAATVNWDLLLPVAKVTLGGNRTLAVTNQEAGGTYILHVIQSAGSNTLTFPASVVWPDAVAPALTATAGYRDILTFTSDGTNLFGSCAQGYAV